MAISLDSSAQEADEPGRPSAAPGAVSSLEQAHSAAAPEHERSEITYDEQFYPARPRPVARLRYRAVAPPEAHGPPVPENAAYVKWLVDTSMLSDADHLAHQLAGQGSMWQHPYAHPNPREVVDRAQVWFTGYPQSFVTRPGESYLAGLADPALWEAFGRIGIDAIHTGPVKLAGGLDGWRLTPSVDGHFDRISMQVDPVFGTEEEFRQLCNTAAEYGGIIIDDIVPGHTGKGADFRLAEMNYADYPGIYHMVAIASEHWHLLPDVPPGADACNLGAQAEADLERYGYIVGRLQRVIFYEYGVKETNWSVTPVVRGVDGIERRWVYLHYFKAGQPSINWLDASCAGMRLVLGDALHTLIDLGSGGVRLDANGFLGVEKSAEGAPGWSEGHPLSEAANHLIASMVRKIGAFSFQELNLSMDDIRTMSEMGADLSYDFVNRPAYHHALVTGDTEFLRLTLNTALALHIDAASLVHALQNHDELTYELVHFTTEHRDETFAYAGAELTGVQLADRIRAELSDALTGPSTPYNRTFTRNGIACTTASVIAATLGITDLQGITTEQSVEIQRVHLLLAMFNALQPGVFALSGWDLSGMLTLRGDQVADLMRQGDTRWINRGAHDLRATQPEMTRSQSGLPVGESLYGPLPSQLEDPESFACGLRRIIAVRRRWGIASARQLEIPDVPHRAMLIMVHLLPGGDYQLTALNFSAAGISGTVRSEHLPPGAKVMDMFSGENLAVVDALHSFNLQLDGYEGMSLLVHTQEEPLLETADSA